MRFFLPLFFTIFGTGFFTLLFKKKFEVVLPLFLMFSSLFVYLLTFIEMFNVGIYLLLTISFIFPIYMVYLFFKSRSEFKEKNKYIFTPGFLLYLLIYIFIFLLNINRGFYTWDEFSHWGVMAKETIRLRDFYNSVYSILEIHSDYPPIITIFQSIWCILAGGYSESLLYTATQILGLSLIMPFVSNLKLKKNFISFIGFASCFILIVTIPILITVGEASFYKTIYIDSILGLLIGYGFAFATVCKKYDRFFYINLSILFSFIILTKQIAILFIVFIFMYVIFNQMKDFKMSLSNINYKRILFIILLLICVPLLLNFFWSIVVNIRGIEGQFKISNIKPFKIIDIYNGLWGYPYQKETITNYIYTILYSFESVKLRFISFTYLEFLLIVCLFIYFIVKFFNIKNVYKFKQLIFFVLITGIVYAIVLLLLYVFCFGSYEGPRLASFARYVNTFILSICSMFFMIYLYYLLKKKRFSLIAISVILIYCFWLKSDAIRTFKPSIHYNSSSDELKIESKYIQSIAKNKKVYILAQCTTGDKTFMFQYLIDPIKVSLENYSIGEKCYDGDIWTKKIDSEKWFEYVKKYDYLYVYNLNDYFINNYGKYFDKLENKKMYKIDKRSKIITLIN